MKTVEKPPGLISDLGSIAGLYGTVFWMMEKRLRYGREWEQRLADKALKPYMHEGDAKFSSRQPHAN
jgi:hypothetical protein